MEANGSITEAKPIYTCKFCEKIYKSRGSLWKHNQKCNNTEMTGLNNLTNGSSKGLPEHFGEATFGFVALKDKEIELLNKEIELINNLTNGSFALKNKEIELLRSQLENQNKTIELLMSQLENQINSNSNSTTKCSGKPLVEDYLRLEPIFNLDLYLNETCKDAININELINEFPSPTKEELHSFTTNKNIEHIIS
jgi:hypothetical protein